MFCSFADKQRDDVFTQAVKTCGMLELQRYTRIVNKVMRLIQYNSVFIFKPQIEFVPLKIVPLGGYTPPETLLTFFVAALEVANRNRF